ncbi:MAG: pyridoxamine 5'-phosphate oxidase family protein [Proteobacteria bacterium]|nr:pyridoxamine 5'-phosphate oxidase family protein [Pseudomonadota bacterium]
MTLLTTPEALRALYEPVRERSAAKELPALDIHATRFIGLSPFVVVATGGVDGMDASPRGGAPGFVKVVDAHTLLVPDSPGNNRLDTLQNILHTPQVGLLFMVPGVDETLRVNGTAVLSLDEAERERCRDERRCPKLVIRVTVQASYLHCAKALMRSELWDARHHQPRSCMPSMGEMLRDQVAGKVTPGTAFETQEQMLERYRQTL